MGYLLPYADVHFDEQGIPRSETYGDIYADVTDHLAEKSHVFLAGNALTSRFRTLTNHARFTIAEAGFGFGINFTLTVQLWRDLAPAGSRLNYISVEKHPVRPEHLRHFMKDRSGAADWLDHYPPPFKGAHRITLDPDVTLTLVFDDLLQLPEYLQQDVDAWFLDGFSPAKNAIMWQNRLFRQMMQCSRPGATVGTYSVARQVREGLELAGFDWQRRPGFGRKAEMLTAKSPGTWLPNVLAEKPIAIIGAGIAGAFTALALQQRGLPATLLDRRGLLAASSAVPQASVHPQLTLDGDHYSRFSLAAYQFLRLQLPALLHESGFLRQPGNQRDQQRHQLLGKLFEAFPDWLSSTAEGLHYGKGGWISTAQLRQTLSQTLHCQITEITEIIPTEGGWQVRGTEFSGLYSELILATGAAPLLPQLSRLPLSLIGGCVLQLPQANTDPRVMSGAVSQFPVYDGLSTLGSTYQHVQSPADYDPEADLEALKSRIRRFNLADEEALTGVSSWHGFRLVSRDRKPLVGPMPDFDQLARMPGPFRRQMRDQDIPTIPGLWLNLAYGSHGMTHAALAGEYLAARILGEVVPLDQATRRSMAPERFYLRDRRQSQTEGQPETDL